MDTFDNSMLADFRLCPRYFQYRHQENLVPDSDFHNYKADFGSALHEAYASWYTHHDASKMDLAFVEYWAPFEGQCVQGIRTMIKGLAILDKYRRWYKDEPYEILEVELGGGIDLGDFLFTFKCDLLVKDKEGHIWILEHKNSAHRGYLIVRPNSQITGYIIGVSILKGIKLKGAILNQIYFRKGRKGAPIDDAIDLVREGTERSEDEIQEWFSDVKSDVRHLKQCQEAGYFPKKTESCTQYGGCQYLELCRCGTEEVRNNVKRALYKEEIWEPYEGAKDGATSIPSKTVVQKT